ncbi:uncharacterized protein TNCV_1486591 [Trichonephila clavipes]|nr:uncharacterized protein TNCV_1486591 [Trichonephila clavipes]
MVKRSICSSHSELSLLFCPLPKLTRFCHSPKCKKRLSVLLNNISDSGKTSGKNARELKKLEPLLYENWSVWEPCGKSCFTKRTNLNKRVKWFGCFGFCKGSTGCGSSPQPSILNCDVANFVTLVWWVGGVALGGKDQWICRFPALCGNRPMKEDYKACYIEGDVCEKKYLESATLLNNTLSVEYEPDHLNPLDYQTCGRTTVPVDLRISGGKPVIKGSWPWQVGVSLNSERKKKALKQSVHNMVPSAGR